MADYRAAAPGAIAAGFDGVEVHGANGYLLEQFLRDSLNDRSDAYGGTIANRARLMLEVMDAVVGEIGAGRTGVRLSPVTPANDLGQDSDAQALYGHVVEKLAPMKLAYLHLIEGATGGPRDAVPFDFEALRRVFKGRTRPAPGWSTTATTARWRSPPSSRPRRPGGLRQAVHLESRHGAAPARERGAQRAEARDLLRRRAAGYTDYPVLAYWFSSGNAKS